MLANSAGRSSFVDWLSKVIMADWKTPEDIKDTFPSADFLGNNTQRVIFDIIGRKYRVIGKYSFGATTIWLYICWVGKHSANEKLCKHKKQFTVFDF